MRLHLLFIESVLSARPRVDYMVRLARERNIARGACRWAALWTDFSLERPQRRYPAPQSGVSKEAYRLRRFERYHMGERAPDLCVVLNGWSRDPDAAAQVSHRHGHCSVEVAGNCVEKAIKAMNGITKPILR